MSLALIGNGASYEFRWRRWSLLRDTIELVAPELVAGSPGFYSIGNGLMESFRLSAKSLAAEIAAIMAAFEGAPLEQLAISPATASVIYLGAKLEGTRPLTPLERNQIAPPGTAKDLAEYFASMLESMARVCERPQDDGCVEVVDG